jgi:hypothetical protein
MSTTLTVFPKDMPEAGDDLILEYSINNQAWTFAATVANADSSAVAPSTFSWRIPANLKSCVPVRFRIRQIQFERRWDSALPFFDTYGILETRLVPCPPNSSPSTSEECACINGYFGVPNLGGCFPCTGNTYKQTSTPLNLMSCRNCPVNSRPNQNLAATDCMCLAGFEPSTGPQSSGSEILARNCRACPAGSFKPTDGNYMCIACPSNSLNSTIAATECACTSGM